MFRVSSSRLAFARLSKLRFSSGSAKPGWELPKDKQWGPEIPDKQYYWDHPTYTGFVLFLRGTRPYLEKLIGDGFGTLKYIGLDCCYHPVRKVIVKHNPDIRLQIVAFLSFYFTVQSINMYLNRYYQQLMDLKHLKSLEEVQLSEKEGFWASESEDLEKRVHLYSSDHSRLNQLWDLAIEEADSKGDFNELVKHLSVEGREIDALVPDYIPSPMTWRFNMIPYGSDNEAAKAFSVPSNEQPHRAFALNFTYNNLAYDWGDYIDRRDNKGGPMRPSRQMFADVYIPPTK